LTHAFGKSSIIFKNFSSQAKKRTDIRKNPVFCACHAIKT